MLKVKQVALVFTLGLTMLTGCASSGNGGAGGSAVFHDGYHRPCDGFSTGDLARDAYCQELEDRIIEDEIVRREIEREIIEREIEENVDPDWGVDK